MEHILFLHKTNYMNKLISTLITAVMLSMAAVSVHAQAPAFPGAEGNGRYVTGGRKADGTTRVYHVTNLNDSGTGSLRWALSQTGPRTIVFDVSGYIDLTKDLDITSNTTIAGQTAPGNGITLRYRTVKLTGCDNVIIRFMRFRRSQIKDVNDGADAVWGRERKNIILDHCSFSWSIDEVASFYDNQNFTMQWCNAAEGLANPGHSKGAHSYGGIWGGKGASFHHNFIAHVQNRAPRFNGARYNFTGYDKTKYDNSIQAERVDFRNCVMYNWGNGNGCYGGPGGGYVNMINNYYKAGPGTKNKTRVTQVSVATDGNSGDNPFPNYASRYYISGNYVTAAGSAAADYDWKGVIYDNGLKTLNNERYIMDADHLYGDAEYVNIDGTDCIKLKLDEPIEAGEVTTHSALNAYEKVIKYGGASLFRDATDARIAEEATNGTVTYLGDEPYVDATGKAYPISNTKGILDFINDPSKPANPKTASFATLDSETRPADYDTDGDGIPDAWEEANGLDKNDAADANLKTIDGRGWYSNLEVYLNSIVENIVKAQNADAISGIDEYYPAYASTGVAAPSVTSEIKRIEYFTADGTRLSSPSRGISIRRITYTNGAVATDKVFKQ